MKKKLVAYVTSSFPDKEFTKELILSMKESGADKIELGIPFSDPVADGPIIEKANLKALANGFKIDDIFDISKSVADKIDTYWMGYFNSFYHKGYEFMSKNAKEFGVKGFIIPDLPYEETLIYQQKHPLISFVAPTDSKQRINTITKNAKEFIYMVAYAGITGSGKSEDLTKIIANVRESSNKELFIGFGVNEKTAKEKSKGVDGVIVGSAFIDILLKDLTYSKKIDKISVLCKNIKEQINS